MARGTCGQYICIAPRHDAVIVVNAAGQGFLGFDEPGGDAASAATE
ncbi:MAG: hypothetical protein H5U18_09890 [Rhodobacteraceae bacterium]|nr:hypothetical protein [Paracoccaceae bacterium]